MMNPIAVFFTQFDFQNVKTRALVLFPPMALVVAFSIIAFGCMFRGVTAPAYVFWLYIIFTGYLMAGVVLLGFADYYHAKRNRGW